MLDYFVSTYVSGSLRSIQRPGNALRMRFRHTPPAYPPALWNVNEVTLAGTVRTNNVCGSWNNGYRTLVAHASPCVWTSIDAIRKDAATVTTLLQQHAQGMQPRKRRRMESVNLQKRLYNLCSSYRDGKRDLPGFLHTLGHNIRLC